MSCIRCTCTVVYGVHVPLCTVCMYELYTVDMYGCGQPYAYVGLARTEHMHRTCGDPPARNTVYAAYIYGCGQP